MNNIWKQLVVNSREHKPEIQDLDKPAIELPLKEAKEIIDLPRPEQMQLPRLNLYEAITNRASLREYSSEKITLEELSFLLWCTHGVKEIRAGKVTFRTVPSAGCWHALNTYLMIQNVEGLKPGIYRFLAIEHKLALIDDDVQKNEKLAELCVTPQPVKKSAVTFLWVAHSYRMTIRYGNRSFRYLFLDAGHICQNLYLAAEAVNCGVCAIGGYDDEKMDALLGLDGENLFLVYAAALGKKNH